MIARTFFRANLIAALAVTGALAACVRGPSLDALPSAEYAGHLTHTTSGNWFVPCGLPAADSAWVTFTDAAAAQYDSLTRTGMLTAGSRRYVHWLAAVTENGEVGPRGPGKPAYLVREVRVLRPAAPGDCGR